MKQQTEFVRFSLLHMPCCGTLLCWINPKMPSYCPECGTKVFLKIKYPEAITLIDDNARLIHKAVDLPWQPKF